MTTRKKKVSINSHINEHPGVFRENGGHNKKKRLYEINEQKKKQTTISTINNAFESKKEVIEDLIEAFSSANIPLEKVNQLLPFFKKHLKEGGAIPQAPTLRQIYLPN
ncbi:16491_t:CDS:2, partial [Funneliformis geosporum]